MSEPKAGARLRSAVCTAEIVVIATRATELDIRCGGAAKVAEGEDSPADAAQDSDLVQGSELGRRDTNVGGAL